MSKIQELQGAGTALVTPFKADESIDEQTFRNFIDFQISEGIDFLVPCGTTGESATLSMEEHLRVVEIVVDQVGGRVPVVAGAGGNNTRHVVELAQKTAALGVTAILSVTPYYNKPTQEGLFRHYETIAKNIDKPVILYNVPGRTQCNLLPDTVIRLAELKNIAGLKCASGDIGQIGEVAIRKPEDFLLLSGDDPNTLPIIALGGVGVISVVSNQAPALVKKLTHLCLDGKFPAAMKIQAELFELMRLNFLETNPGPVKAGLAMMGLMEENYRLPLIPISTANKEKLGHGLKKMGLL